jgi:opacity protein-like surface antigen
MKNGWLLSALAVALLAAIATPASAQGREDEDDQDEAIEFIDDSRRMEVSGFLILQGSGINYIFLPEGKESVTSANNSRLTAEVRYSFFLNRYKTLGVEGSLAYTRAGGSFQQPGDYSDPDNPIIYPVENVDHSVFRYGANAIYNFGLLDVVPFLTLGFGANSISPSEDSSYPLDGIYYDVTFSAGFKYFIMEWFGVRVEILDTFYLFSGDEVDKNLNTVRFRLGGVFTF